MNGIVDRDQLRSVINSLEYCRRHASASEYESQILGILNNLSENLKAAGLERELAEFLADLNNYSKYPKGNVRRQQLILGWLETLIGHLKKQL